MNPVAGAFVPSNLIPGARSLLGVIILMLGMTQQLLVILELTYVLYQNVVGKQQSKSRDTQVCNSTLEVHPSLTQPLEVTVRIVKTPPVNSLNLDTYSVINKDIEYEPHAKNKAFILARSTATTGERKNKKMTDWTATNQKLCNQRKQAKTEVGCMPLFHAHADD